MKMIKQKDYINFFIVNSNMGILDMPWYDRPGNRLIKEGAESLSDSELLEIILGKTKEESVVTLANRLLKKYNLNKLEELGFQELKKEFTGIRKQMGKKKFEEKIGIKLEG